MPKAELTEDEVADLLEDAEAAFPDSDFVASVREWYEEKGFITLAQADALERISNGSKS